MCIHKNGCIFIHEDSEACKYGEMCERKNCLYKNEGVRNDNEDENKDEPDDNEKNNSEDNENVIKEADQTDVEDEFDDENKDDDKVVAIENDDAKDENIHNSTFLNPSQFESEIVEFDVLVTCKDHWLRNDQSLYTQRLVSNQHPRN